MSLKTPLKAAIQAALGSFGYRLARLERSTPAESRSPAPETAFSEPVIGMDACLRGLAARGYSPRQVIDVGAAHGAWTSLALRYWPMAHYLLIEPLVEHEPELAEMCRTFPNVDFVLAGAGRQSDERPIGVQANLDGSSFLYPGREQRLVPVVTIDGLVQAGSMAPPEFIKMDVQGFELEVLAGARASLAHCELVLLEVQFFRFAPAMRLFHETVAELAESGFQPYEVVDVLRRPLDGAMGQCDLLFARPEHWLLADNRWG